MKDERTLAQLAQEALDVQDASNLSGVVHGFSRAVSRLWEIAREEGWAGTDEINRHPICTLWIDKLADLNRRRDAFDAWDEVIALTEKKADALLES